MSFPGDLVVPAFLFFGDASWRGASSRGASTACTDAGFGGDATAAGFLHGPFVAELFAFHSLAFSGFPQRKQFDAFP